MRDVTRRLGLSLTSLSLLWACTSEPSASSSAPAGAAATLTHAAVATSRDLDQLASEGAVDAPTQASLAEFLARGHAYVLLDRHVRRVVHATGRLSEPSPEPDEAIVRSFTRKHAGMLQLGAPELSLRVERAPTRFQGSRVYRLRQVVQGVPVMRRALKLEIATDGSVRTLSGVTGDELGALPPLTPTLAADEAAGRARSILQARAPLRQLFGPQLMLRPGDRARPAQLLWRVGGVVAQPGPEGVEPSGRIVTLDAHDGALVGVADTTRSCTDGSPGTVVTSTETLRAQLSSTSAEPRDFSTCYSSMLGQYYLEDHSHPAELFCYNATSYDNPSTASAWFTACSEPACYTASASSNHWLTGDSSFIASDYRNGQKTLQMFRDVFGREGADGAGEDLIIESGLNYNNATSIGMARSIALGKPDYANGKPSYGVIDVMAHELTHTMSWHEWVGLFDYGIEGSVHGVEGAMDEHISDVFGVIALYHLADEAWLGEARWAHAAERYYGANWPLRNDPQFLVKATSNRNYYRGTSGSTPRAHVSQMYTGADDSGGVHWNAVVLGRAVYLFTEGGFAHQDPYGASLAGWPTDGPTHKVEPIGMDKMEKLFYHAEITASFTTALGNAGFGDITQAEGDFDAMKAQMQRVAHIVLASCLQVADQLQWPVKTCASVRNGYAAVGLMDPDQDMDGHADPADNCVKIENPDQADLDGDGAGNVCDNCPDEANPTQADADKNGKGDACELANGKACAKGSSCSSGFCVNAVCCESECGAGVNDCLACSQAKGAASDGTCTQVAVACNDGNGCTTGDTCQSGECTGTPKSCAPPDECHTAACEASSGECVSTPAKDGTPCKSGACVAGECKSGGAAGASGGSPDGGEPIGTQSSAVQSDGGCGCRMTGQPGASWLAWLAACAGAATMLRRRAGR